MIRSKHFTVIAIAAVCFSLLACVFIVYAAGAFDTTNVPEYQKKLFNGEVLTIDIQVSPDDWQDVVLDNPNAKEYVSADLVINGVKFESVGVRTKGNSSLSGVSVSDSDRYSLNFKFDYYIKGQTCYGLDVMCINNIISDATYMKDYIAQDIMSYIGVPSPLTNYAKVTVNGEDHGFYMVLERYDKAFLDREFDTSAGQLYNIRITMGNQAGGNDIVNNGGDMKFAPPQNNTGDGSTQTTPEGTIPEGMTGGTIPEGMTGGAIPDRTQTTPENTSDGSTQTTPNGNRTNRENTGGNVLIIGGIGGGGMGGNGGSLEYNGDDFSNYASIFNNPVFNSRDTDENKAKIVEAIKNLNEGTDLEKYWNVDEILRYLAAHTFTVNLDSYISGMAQNYFIYEKDGKLSIIPWDYNLAFGGYQSNSASSVVNFPIDTPVSGVTMESRPLINMLLEVEEYRERYHQYLREIVEGYFLSGRFAEVVAALDAKISPYVETDVSAFFTLEQYKSALESFKELCMLRAESILGQLDGEIPSTATGQSEHPELLVDASHLSLSSGMGGGMFGGGGISTPAGSINLDNIDMQNIQQIMQIINAAENGELSAEQRESLYALGLTDADIEQYLSMTAGMFQNNTGQDTTQGDRRNQGNGFMPDRNLSGQTAPQTPTEVNWMFYIITGGVFAAVILFLALFKRRRMTN